MDAIVDPQEPTETEPEVVEVSDYTLEQAAIGDVQMMPVTQVLPADWQNLDGTTQPSYVWPEFVAAMRIARPTFELPAARRVLPGYRYAIKLGRRRELAAMQSVMLDPHQLLEGPA